MGKNQRANATTKERERERERERESSVFFFFFFFGPTLKKYQPRKMNEQQLDHSLEGGTT